MRSVRIIWLYISVGRSCVSPYHHVIIKLYARTTTTQGYLLRIIYKRCFFFRFLRTVFSSSCQSLFIPSLLVAHTLSLAYNNIVSDSNTQPPRFPAQTRAIFTQSVISVYCSVVPITIFLSTLGSFFILLLNAY